MSSRTNSSPSSRSRTARTAPRVGALSMAIVLVVCSAALLTFGSWRVQCPGLYYDEVLFVEGWQSQRHFAWYVGDVPVMSLSYLGALKTWLYWPWRDQLSPAVVRLPGVLLAIASLWLTAAVCRRIAGGAAAFVVAVLLAVDPAFIFLHRLDWGPVAIATFLRMASLAAVLRWQAGASDFWLVAAAFLMGLGLYDKVIFAWYVMALAAAIVATWPHWRLPRLRVAAAGAVAVAIGAAPLLAYNLLFPFATLRNNDVISDVPFVQQTVQRVALAAHTLSGALIYRFVNDAELAAPLSCPGLAPALARVACGRFPLDGAWLPYATVIMLLAIVTSRTLRAAFATRFLAVLLVGIFLIMLPLAQATGAHHVAMLLPFPQMVIAVAGAEAWRRRSRWRLPLTLIAMGVFATSLAVTARTSASFAGLCGRGAWSPATYRLAEFAAAHSDDRILLGDWGFASQLHALAPAATLDDWSWALMEDRARPADLTGRPGRRTFLLLHAQRTTVSRVARQRALAHVRAAGLRAKRRELAADLDGRPTAFVLELVLRRRAQRSPFGPDSSTQ